MKNKDTQREILRGLIALLLLLGFSVSAQSLTGTRGLIKAPTARMYESGTLAIGMGYVPAKFFKRTYGESFGLRTGNAGLNTYVAVNILPFAEIMFRYSHEFNMKINPKTRYFPDRMFAFRFLLFNETKSLPAVLIGLNDISKILNISSGGDSFSSVYLTFNKKIINNNFILDFSFGTSIFYDKLNLNGLKGFFGGIEIENENLKNKQLLIEYDSKSLNFGIQSLLFNRIHSIIGLMDFEPMFVIAYRYKI